MPPQPPTCYLDHLDNLAQTEKLGVVRTLVRKARVVFHDISALPLDFSALNVALTVCPAPFSQPTDINGNLIAGYGNLALVERNPKLAFHDDISCVDVELKYEHVLDGPNQVMGQSAALGFRQAGILFGKGRCSITEKTTNFYYQPGKARTFDNRVQILTAHTFPSWDMGVVGGPLNPNLPYTVIQGGEVSVPFPQGNFQLQGVLATTDPWKVARLFVAKINVNQWLQGDPLTWLCSEAQFEMLNYANIPNQSEYKFTFEFQQNTDGWNPTVAFNDQRTGRPPAGVVKANVAADANTLATANANVVFAQAALALSPTPFNVFLLTTAQQTEALIGPPDGVMRLTNNPINQLALQPAGVWQVPFLETVDFNQLFRAVFEGGLPVGVQ